MRVDETQDIGKRAYRPPLWCAILLLLASAMICVDALAGAISRSRLSLGLSLLSLAGVAVLGTGRERLGRWLTWAALLLLAGAFVFRAMERAS